jgi:hypothetical protein
VVIYQLIPVDIVLITSKIMHLSVGIYLLFK